MEAKDAHGFKKSKLTRDRDRDVSEKMALGQASDIFPMDEAIRSMRQGSLFKSIDEAEAAAAGFN